MPTATRVETIGGFLVLGGREPLVAADRFEAGPLGADAFDLVPFAPVPLGSGGFVDRFAPDDVARDRVDPPAAVTDRRLDPPVSGRAEVAPSAERPAALAIADQRSPPLTGGRTATSSLAPTASASVTGSPLSHTRLVASTATNASP